MSFEYNIIFLYTQMAKKKQDGRQKKRNQPQNVIKSEVKDGVRITEFKVNQKQKMKRKNQFMGRKVVPDHLLQKYSRGQGVKVFIGYIYAVLYLILTIKQWLFFS